MQEAVAFFVQHGSYALMFAALVVAGLGIPLPEDIVMISGSILAQRGMTSLPVTVAVLGVGVLVGDTILFFLARRAGKAIYEWRIVRRMIASERRRWLEDKIEKHGGLVVFVARNVAGFRAPTFALAAIHGMSYPRFIAWDAAALTISMPLWMGLGWFFGDSIDQLVHHTASAERMVGLSAVALLVVGVAVHAIVRFVRRRRDARNSLPPAERPRDAQV